MARASSGFRVLATTRLGSAPGMNLRQSPLTMVGLGTTRVPSAKYVVASTTRAVLVRFAPALWKQEAAWKLTSPRRERAVFDRDRVCAKDFRNAEYLREISLPGRPGKLPHPVDVVVTRVL